LYLRFSKVTAKGHTYEYAQVCQTVRVGKRTKRKVLVNLGRRDLLQPQDIDDLIAVLRRLASPETEARRPIMRPSP
jgi:hypothetical protein